MRVRGLILPIERQGAGFCERLFYYSLYCNLKAGRMTTTANGKMVSEADARWLVRTRMACSWNFEPGPMIRMAMSADWGEPVPNVALR